MAKKKEKSILEHFGWGTKDTTEAEDKEDKNPVVKVEDLQAQIAALQSRLDASERERALMTAYSPQVDQGPKPPGQFKIEYKDLPDPVEDPKGYATAIARQTQEAVSSYNKAYADYAAYQASGNNRVEQLWSAFSEKYEDYAADADKAEFAAMKVVNDAKARGLDPERYMFNNREIFFQDIVKTMDAIFGKPGGPGDGDGKTKDQVDDTTPDDDEEDDSRSLAMFGGMESGHKPGKGVEAPTDMIKDLHDLQRKSGFF